MEVLADYHLHSTGSDGKLTPEEVVLEAIGLGMKFICFTDHYPLPPEVRIEEKVRHSEEYYLEVLRLKKKYHDKISIAFGGEFDWLEDFQDYTMNAIHRRDYDFVLGSTHFIKGNNGDYVPVDFSLDLCREIANDYGGVEGFFREYYKEVRKMINSGMFDCVAHLDLIKRRAYSLITQKEEWYIDEIRKTLVELKKNNVFMEINSSGLRLPVAEQHPSTWIIKEAKKLGIKITVGSDGHSGVGRAIGEVLKIVKDAGYDSFYVFRDRKPIKVLF